MKLLDLRKKIIPKIQRDFCTLVLYKLVCLMPAVGKSEWAPLVSWRNGNRPPSPPLTELGGLRGPGGGEELSDLNHDQLQTFAEHVQTCRTSC